MKLSSGIRWRSLVLLVVLCFKCGVNAYNFLILYPFPSHSHQVSIMSVTEKLIEKGHKVTVVAPNRVPGLKENYTYIDASSLYKYMSPDSAQEASLDLQKQLTKWHWIEGIKDGLQIIEKPFLSEQFLDFLRRVKEEGEVFDAVLIESLWPTLLVSMANLIAETKPIIGLASTNTNFFMERPMGTFEHFSYLPFVFNAYTDKMNLLEKTENWLSGHIITNGMLKTMEEHSREFFKKHSKHFGENAQAHVDDVAKKICLLINFSNSIYYYPRLLGPNVIEVGPTHLKAPKQLPKILQNWCDGADKGVIFMSLGSNMKSKSLPLEARENFLRVFKELPAGYRVVWKWELDGPIPGQSDNILAQKWLPQQDILGHPKTKVFITQGGLQSFQETVHHAVPIVGIPWFGDQEGNVLKMSNEGIGVGLRPQELLSYEKVKTAIHTVLFNQSYGDNIKRMSVLSRDFSDRSLDTAVFWIEHVARHGGADHLRIITAQTTLFEFFCLDILLFLFTVAAVLLYLLFKTLKLLYSLVCIRKTKIKSS